MHMVPNYPDHRCHELRPRGCHSQCALNTAYSRSGTNSRLLAPNFLITSLDTLAWVPRIFATFSVPHTRSNIRSRCFVHHAQNAASSGWNPSSLANAFISQNVRPAVTLLINDIRGCRFNREELVLISNCYQNSYVTPRRQRMAIGAPYCNLCRSQLVAQMRV